MSLEWILLALMYVSAGSVLVPIFIAIIKARTLDTSSRVLLFYLIYILIANVSSIMLAKLSIPNLFISYINAFIGFAALSFILFKSLHFKQSIWLLFTLIFGIFVFIDYRYLEGHKLLSSVSSNTQSILLIGLCIAYFYSLIHKPEIINLLSLPTFWINTGILILFSGSFFLTLFFNNMMELQYDLVLALYSINSVMQMIFNALVTVAFLKIKNGN